MLYEFRWYKSIDDTEYKLQFRMVPDYSLPLEDDEKPNEWEDIPFILEGVGEFKSA